jgi:hypothetical protein
VIVGDDGACIFEQMQVDALRKALLDDSFLIGKPWLFKYQVYLVYQQEDDDTTLYYQELAETPRSARHSFYFRHVPRVEVT